MPERTSGSAMPWAAFQSRRRLSYPSDTCQAPGNCQAPCPFVLRKLSLDDIELLPPPGPWRVGGGAENLGALVVGPSQPWQEPARL